MQNAESHARSLVLKAEKTRENKAESDSEKIHRLESEFAKKKDTELQELQDRLRAASVNKRKLDITLYLTGAKAEQLKPKPVRGRVSETQRTAHGLAHASASPPRSSTGARDREGFHR